MKNKEKNNKYSHLNQIQRDRIEALLLSGCKQKDIAKVLNIDPSTVCREKQRNKVKNKQTNKERYSSVSAQRKSKQRRLNAKYQWKKININKRLRKYIIKGLKKHWSPDEISGRMKDEKQPFYASKNSIYRWLYSVHGAKYCQYLSTHRYWKKKRKTKKTKKTLIPDRIGIELRPLGAINLSRYGHFEGDTIVSGRKTHSKTSLSVIYERKAKYVNVKRIANLKPNSNNMAINEMKNEFNVIKSLTLDNGIENTKHKELNISTFFCDPYSAWQKGGIENINRMIRRFIPKGCDVSNYSNRYIRKTVKILNNKPRKSLKYKTPYEVMEKHNMLKKQKSNFLRNCI